MTKHATKIEGAWLLQPKVFQDERGFFFESWNPAHLRKAGLIEDFVQDNFSRSFRNVLRGLHYQSGKAAQGKLVWVSNGSVFDVIVDLRSNSPTYGVCDWLELNAQNQEMLWVPPGCAHGFLVTGESADFHYKCTKPYQPEAERALSWNDPTLNIPWPLQEDSAPILSSKDASAPLFQNCEKFHEA